MKIYYLGPVGSFSYIAAKNAYPKDQLISTNSFEEIILNTESDHESLGILPIENSITSDVYVNIDSIFARKLYIVKEIYLSITMNLIGLKNSKVEKIKTVYSHPKALVQCTKYISSHKLSSVEASSTAAAQEIVMQKNDLSLAAIGSNELVDKEKLEILESNIGNEKNNKTRFVSVSSKQSLKDEKKATAIFSVKHEPGSLAKVLGKLAHVGINLTKIESRPIPGTEWEYKFWIDFEIEKEKMKVALNTLKENSLDVRIVGVYEKGKLYS